MAGYSLLTSEETVQVLSPTVANDVVYCTIRTTPSGVIAAIPVQRTVFNAGQAGVELTNFADAIEQIMALSQVVAGSGQQSIDTNGLLADEVAFTVEYVPAANAATSITAEAVVPTPMLNFTDAEIGRTLLSEVEAIITGVYNNLKAAAGG